MRVYAVEEGTGRRVFIALECDDCGARTGPDPGAKSGWEKRGTYYNPGDSRNTEWALCPECASTHGLGRA